MTLTVLAVSSEPLLRALAAEPGATSKRLAEASGKKINNIARDLDILANAGLIDRHPPRLLHGGIEALAAIDRAKAGAPAVVNVGGVAEIPVDLIDPDPAINPRKHFDDEALDELAASIEIKGVLQPILVRQGLVEGRYRVVAGERRFRAAKRAGRASIPAIARQMDDVEALEVALIENIQRSDLAPLEEARGFEAVIAARQARDPTSSRMEAKQVIAEATKRTVRYVEQRLALLRLSPTDQAQLERGEISIEVARNRAASAPPKIELDAGQLLMLAEIADFVAKGKGLRSSADRAGHWTMRDDQVLDELVRRGLVGRWTQWDTKLEHVQLKQRGLQTLDDLCPALASRRAPMLEKLRLSAGRPYLPGDGGAYATAWLNPPHAAHPDDIRALAERHARDAANEAERAEQQRVQLAEREERERRLRDDRGPKGRAFLKAVRAFEAIAPTLKAPAFNAAFRDLLAAHEATAPWSMRLDKQDGDPVLLDAEGRPNVGAAAALEARRRLLAIAVNYAAGFKPWSGEELATEWSVDLRLGRQPGDVVRIAGGAVYEIVEVLTAADGARSYLAVNRRDGKSWGKPTSLTTAAIEELLHDADEEDETEDPDENESPPPDSAQPSVGEGNREAVEGAQAVPCADPAPRARGGALATMLNDDRGQALELHGAHVSGMIGWAAATLGQAAYFAACHDAWRWLGAAGVFMCALIAAREAGAVFELRGLRDG